MAAGGGAALAEDYVQLGLDLGRHVAGLVTSYQGPPELAERAAIGRPTAPAALVARARTLLADLGADTALEPRRRAWLAAQVGGLLGTARRVAGERAGYLDEVEQAYGARPAAVPEDELAAAHRLLDAALPGTGPIGPRRAAWREAQRIPPEALVPVVLSLLEDLRGRTARAVGLPDGEAVEVVEVAGRPWAGGHTYLGRLRSRVLVNTDVPVLASRVAHLVAHEAYPGHHTEHCRKDVGLLAGRSQVEESLWLLGTPRCLVSEGAAEVALEALLGTARHAVVAEHLRPLGISHAPDVAAAVADAGRVLAAVRANASIGLHVHGWSPEEAAAYITRWAPTTAARAAQQVRFLVDPTWRGYITCYTEGARRARAFLAGDPVGLARLLDEQLLPADLVAGQAHFPAPVAAP